jgi:predicted Zn finger-like uncharacterized protein
MIITCPKCSTHYRIDPEVIGPSGREVRCVKCGHAWREEPEHIRAAGAAAQVPPRQARLPGPAPQPSEPSPARTTERWAGPPARGYPEGAAATATAAAVSREPSPQPAPPEAEPAPPPKPRPAEPPAREPRAREPRGRPRWIGLALVWVGAVVLLLAGVAAVAYVARDRIVVAWPDASRLYAKVGIETKVLGLGLEVRNVTTVRRLVDDARTLEIEGEVVNVSNEVQTIPTLRASLKDEQGTELMDWTFDVRAHSIDPGKSLSFRTVANDPPASATDLSISFTENGTK